MYEISTVVYLYIWAIAVCLTKMNLDFCLLTCHLLSHTAKYATARHGQHEPVHWCDRRWGKDRTEERSVHHHSRAGVLHTRRQQGDHQWVCGVFRASVSPPMGHKMSLTSSVFHQVEWTASGLSENQQAKSKEEAQSGTSNHTGTLWLEPVLWNQFYLYQIPFYVFPNSNWIFVFPNSAVSVFKFLDCGFIAF